MFIPFGMVIIWCRSTIIFYVIARAMACRPVRVQTGECKDLIWIWRIYDGCAPYFLFYCLHELVHVQLFIVLLMIILCFTEQQSWRLCPHSLWQVWPPWPWPWLPSAPPSIFFSKWRFSHPQAPVAAATLLLDPTRLMSFTPCWQLQPWGVHVPFLVDGGPKVDGQWSLLGLGAVAEDNNEETLNFKVWRKL